MPNAYPSDTSREPGRWPRIAQLLPALLLPVVLWACATLFLGGATGKYLDDYSINLRDASGQLPPGFTLADLWKAYPFFWRPLHIAMCFGAGTFLWESDRLIDIFCAVVHGLAALSVWGFVRSLTCSRLAPVAAALVLLTAPYAGEVVFWFCTISTAIATALLMVTLKLVVGFARMPSEGPFAGCRRLGVLPITSFLIPCFFEAPAAGLAVAPVVYLACCPTSQRWLVRVLRSGMVAAACGLPCVLYLSLMVASSPKNSRGGANSFVRPERFFERLREFTHNADSFVTGYRAEHFLGGSITQGWRSLQSAEGVVWLALVVASAALFARWWMTASNALSPQARRVLVPSSAQPELVLRPGWIMLAAIMLFIMPWLPAVLVDRQIVELRLWYAPIAGLSVVLGLLLAWSLVSAQRSWARVPIRATSLLAVLVISVLGAMSLVGFQVRYARQYALDQRILEQIRRLVPDPPEGAVFMPIEVHAFPVSTDFGVFNQSAVALFEARWTAVEMIRRSYGRDDLLATTTGPWSRYGIEFAQDHGLPFPAIRGTDAAKVRSHTHFPWDQVVPFVVDPTGQVMLVRRVIVERPTGRDLDIRPPIVTAALESPSSASVVLRAAAPESLGDPMFASLASTWFRGGPRDGPRHPSSSDAPGPPRVQPHTVKCFGVTRQAVVLDPRATSDLWSSAHARLDGPGGPCDGAQSLVLRVSIQEHDLDKHQGPGACVVEAFIGSARASILIDRREMLRARRWVPLVIDVPGENSWPSTLTIRVRPSIDPDVPTLAEPIWVSVPTLSCPPAPVGAAPPATPGAERSP
jgi:hypothetical protein